MTSGISVLTRAVGAYDHVQGLDSAAVTLLEYGDYECPGCRRAHGLVKELQSRLGVHLRVAFRNFPLVSSHPHANNAAEAVEAAAVQDRFWEMHDVLYSNQAHLSDRHLKVCATQLGLDMARFNQEMAAHAYLARVFADFLSGVRSGVSATPVFFINGVRYMGHIDVSDLRTAIENAA